MIVFDGLVIVLHSLVIVLETLCQLIIALDSLLGALDGLLIILDILLQLVIILERGKNSGKDAHKHKISRINIQHTTIHKGQFIDIPSRIIRSLPDP